MEDENDSSQASSSKIQIENEPLSTLFSPLPIPNYEFDSNLSEDENFLTWCCILARHSSSEKGHMGTIFIKKPETGDPSKPGEICFPLAKDRIIAYGNNTPILFHRQSKFVPEIHAEALVISRCARSGIALKDSTVYVSFPPCNDCVKLLISSGISRCCFRKGILNDVAQGEGSLVAAKVYGLELIGTLEKVIEAKLQKDELKIQQFKDEEKQFDIERDQRVRNFWSKVGEEGKTTRARNQRWWKDFKEKYNSAEKLIRLKYGENNIKKMQEQKNFHREKRKQEEKEKQFQQKEFKRQKKFQNGFNKSLVGGERIDKDEDVDDDDDDYQGPIQEFINSNNNVNLQQQ